MALVAGIRRAGPGGAKIQYPKIGHDSSPALFGLVITGNPLPLLGYVSCPVMIFSMMPLVERFSLRGIKATSPPHCPTRSWPTTASTV